MEEFDLFPNLGGKSEGGWTDGWTDGRTDR